MSDEVNVVALVRGEEQYVFVFDEARRTQLLRLLGRFAADPELSLTWYDAAILSQKIREMMPATVTESLGSEWLPSETPRSDARSGVRTKATRFQIP
jgi:hypothetical protein